MTDRPTDPPDEAAGGGIRSDETPTAPDSSISVETGEGLGLFAGLTMSPNSPTRKKPGSMQDNDGGDNDTNMQDPSVMKISIPILVSETETVTASTEAVGATEDTEAKPLEGISTEDNEGKDTAKTDSEKAVMHENAERRAEEETSEIQTPDSDPAVVTSPPPLHDNSATNESQLRQPSDSGESFVMVDSPTRQRPSNREQQLSNNKGNSLPKRACIIHPSTPIPNSDTSLRILRKFLTKSSHFLPITYGGTKASSFISYIFGTGEEKEDECCLIYSALVRAIRDDNDSDEIGDGDVNVSAEEDVIIESILGQQGDTMSKSRLAMAAFCTLIEVWAEATFSDGLLDQKDLVLESTSSSDNTASANGSSHMNNSQRSSSRNDLLTTPSGRRRRESLSGIGGGNSTRKRSVITGELLALALDCAQSLIAHGCFDGVVLVIGNSTSFEEDNDAEANEAEEEEKKDLQNVKAVSVLADSVFLCNLSSEETELSALKFLLTTGCRTARDVSVAEKSPNDSFVTSAGEEAMLRGSQLLQAIRMCYHVYLRTASEPNRTTARAALRQLVSSVFTRMEKRNEVLKVLENTVNDDKSHKLNTDVAVDGEVGEGLTASNPEGANITTPSTKGEEVVDREDSIVAGLAATTTTASTNEPSADGGFPSADHKDAFLVLRSLCKLSMKPLPDSSGVRWDGGGLASSSNMNDAPSAAALRRESIDGGKMTSASPHKPPILQPSTSDPALDSKILALDQLLEVLQRESTAALLISCPQLLYAVRHYLCHSLLKNCTSDNSIVVNLSLRLFVPLIRHFRSHLKTEIEAFVTNVFFVILDSKNSTVEHKMRVVMLFEEICSDPDTLAEIFLNYDCDLSAVDLFQRIVSTLAKVAKIGLDSKELNPSAILVAGAGVGRAEKIRQEHRELRLEAMRAVKQVLASLYESIETPITSRVDENDYEDEQSILEPTSVQSDKIPSISLQQSNSMDVASANPSGPDASGSEEKKTLVQIYDSKKKRREEEANAIIRFNQKPSAGIKSASQYGLINGQDPADVANYLLANKDLLDKTQIGEYLGREPDYQDGFPLKVLHQYVSQLDFAGLLFDEAIRFYLSGFRLPGEAQKIDRIMEKFAERYTTQNPEVFPTADAAFILAFSIIMLNTDLHNPAIKEERRMTKDGFIRNNRGICDGQDLPEELLTSIFDRIKTNPISLKEDDDARERTGHKTTGADVSDASTALNPSSFFNSHYIEMDRTRESNFQKERDQILRNTESMLRRKKKSKGNTGSGAGVAKGTGKFVRTKESGLRDEYVTPMFDVTWGPALAVFSTAMESANGTMGSLLAIASDDEIELAAENAASAIEVCLDGFQLAICTAGLCGNETARSAFAHALSNFSLLGTGRLLEHRHIRCVQALLELARDYGELLGNSWEHVFKALSEVARLRQVYELAARVERAEIAAMERRQKRSAEIEAQRQERAARVALDLEESEDGKVSEVSDSDSESYFSDSDQHEYFEEEMDRRAIDEANARKINEDISEDLVDSIYQRSSFFSAPTVKDFIFQLCRVSRMEIAGYGGHVGSHANDIDLTAVHYRQHHTLLATRGNDGSVQHRNQPDIHSLQKLVEVTHYNMESRPRLVFANIWVIVSGHLTSTALHTNAAVAMYAVDSFRQLSIQFLKREELGVFEFQRRFLKPLEAVMRQCQNSSVKEFLLKSVEQIILLFGSGVEEDNTEISEQQLDKKYQGALRSGWRPILNVVGLASEDEDDKIAELGFKMLSNQLRQCLNIERLTENLKGKDTSQPNQTNDLSSSSTVLRVDRFINLVDALLMFVSGRREEISVLSIDHLVTLSRYLADESIPLPQKSTAAFSTANGGNEDGQISSIKNHSSLGIHSSEELELWWPILLGLSQSVGDARPNIRIKSLVTLLAIINQHFFPLPGGTVQVSDMLAEDGDEMSPAPQHGDLQTLQLIFRGVLTPTLEHAEMNANNGNNKRLPLPEGFIRFMTKGFSSPGNGRGGRKDRIEGNNPNGNSWLETTFDHLMDGSIALALKSIEIYKTDALVEEVLAMFNNCLISDSGALAVRGLKRLNHFITSDLALEGITNDTWATVSHMLRRCLTVRGLPSPPESRNETVKTISQDTKTEANAAIKEFVTEEKILAERRYIGSNATMIIGTLLSDKQYVSSMGMRWYLFLLTGLGKSIRQWDEAASVMTMHSPHSVNSNLEGSPPHYAENALYGRKWMVRLLKRLMSRNEILSGSSGDLLSSDTVPIGKRSALLAKNLIKDECESLFSSLLSKENEISGKMNPVQALEMDNMIEMMCDLLDSINKLDDAELAALASLTPTFSACIQINDKSVRSAVHKILQRLFNGPLLDKVNSIEEKES